jgi:hypothetical protein
MLPALLSSLLLPTWLTKRSRKTPEQLTTTSTRGRPSSERGITSSLFTRPRASGTGRTPTIIITWVHQEQSLVGSAAKRNAVQAGCTVHGCDANALEQM